MHAGWTNKTGAPVLGVAEKKFPQAWRPAIRKVATAFLADPHLTVIDLLEAMGDIIAERNAETAARTRAMARAAVPLPRPLNGSAHRHPA